MTIELRLAQASDIDAIVTLERSTESAPHWPLTAYSAILEETESRRCLIVAYSGEVLAGFAVGLVHPASTDGGGCIAELESVVVATAARRAGIGRALCSAVLDWSRSRNATEVVLEVRAASTGVIALYSALGFAETGRRPRYYREPEDTAVLMRLKLE